MTEPRATRHQLRKQFHGPILTAFSEQVWLYDPNAQRRVRYTKQAWKTHLARQFLELQMDDEGRIVDPPSTELVDDETYRLFLLEVQAYGVVDLNIAFPEVEESRYQNSDIGKISQAEAGQPSPRNSKG